MAAPHPESRKPRSPFAGCTIVIVAIAVMVFLVGFVIWNLFRLDSEIAKFTTSRAEPVPVLKPLEHTAAFNALQSKLELFRDACGKGELASLKLSREDINLSIGARDEFKDLRGRFSVTDIGNGRLEIAISFPLRGKPLSDQLRYLNGTMVAVPELAGGEIILNIEEIRVPGKEVPEGFLGQMSPYRVTQRYLEDEKLGPWMKRLTGLSVQGNLLVLHSDPAKLQTDQPQDLRPFLKRALLLFGGIVILFVVVLVVLLRISRRRAAASPPDA